MADLSYEWVDDGGDEYVGVFAGDYGMIKMFDSEDEAKEYIESGDAGRELEIRKSFWE